MQSRYDLRYVTGFTGSHGLALVRARPSAQEPHVFLTDFRYETQSEQQVASGYRREIVVGELIDAAAAQLGEAGGRLGFDETALTVGRPSQAARAARRLVGARAARRASSPDCGSSRTRARSR